MKVIKLLSVLVIAFSVQVLSAQTAPTEKVIAKSEASSKKKQTRAEFNESMFKLYKANRLEMKDMQIQFINKQFQADLENEKSMIELRNKINPIGRQEKNQELFSLMEKKNKEFQEKNKKEGEEFYSKKMAEKGKSFFDKINKLSQEFEATQQPAPPAQPQQAPPPQK